VAALEFALDHPCGLRIDRELQVSAVQSIGGVTVSDMRTGYVWYRLPEAEIAGQHVAMSLCFYEHWLDSLSFAVIDPEFGSSWEDWSEQKERARAEATERWLALVGHEVGKYPWGEVSAGFDPKGGGGAARVRFHRN